MMICWKNWCAQRPSRIPLRESYFRSAHFVLVVEVSGAVEGDLTLNDEVPCEEVRA